VATSKQIIPGKDTKGEEVGDSDYFANLDTLTFDMGTVGPADD